MQEIEKKYIEISIIVQMEAAHSASKPNYPLLNCNIAVNSDTLTPTTSPFSTIRSHTLVPNLILIFKNRKK